MATLKARGDQKKIDKRFDRKMKVLQESYKQVEQYLPRDEIYSQIIVYVFDNCSLEDIVRNLNNPNMAILNAMENSLPPSLRTRNYPKIQGDMDDNHFDWLKKQVGAMKEVLAEFKIPFDKKDDGRAFMTFLDYAGKLYAEVFKREAKSKSKPQDEKIKSLIFKLTTYKIIDSKKLLQYAINKYGMKKITSWFDKKKEESGELDIADYRLLDFERASSKMQEEKEENKKFKIIPLDKENENDL